MKKRFFLVFLTVVFLISSCFSVFANEQAEEKKMNFSDVSETDWFFSEVSHLYSLSVIDGYPDGTFRPKDEVTRAEFVKMLVCAVDLQNSADVFYSDIPENEWYTEYISRAIFENVLIFDKDEFYPNEPVSRIECAEFIYRILRAKYFVADTPFNDTSDVYAVSLYNECIMQGSVDIKGERYFYPESTLSRAEAAAVISRVISYRANKESFITASQLAHPECVPLAFMESPKSFDDFYYVYLYAWENGMETLEFTYSGIPYNSKEMNTVLGNCSAAYTFASNHHPEFSNMQKVSYTKTGNHNATKLTFTFLPSTDDDFETLVQKNFAARSAAQSIVSQITVSCENDAEKLYEIHTYLAKNVKVANADDADAYTIYGALVNGSAMCQGISAAFNYMCSLAGIKSYSVSNDEHMWNTALLQGVPVFFDATFDGANYRAYGEDAANEYFALSLQEIQIEEYAAGKWSAWDFDFKFYR